MSDLLELDKKRIVDLIDFGESLAEDNDVAIDDMRFHMSAKESFLMEADENYWIPFGGPPDIKKFTMDGMTLFALDAVNIRFPRPKLNFLRLSNNPQNGINYDIAITPIDVSRLVLREPPTNSNITMPTIENLIFFSTSGFALDYIIKLKKRGHSIRIIIKNDYGHLHLIIASEVGMESSRFLGLATRIRYALAFLFAQVNSDAIFVLGNNNGDIEASLGSKVNVWRTPSLFFRKDLYGYEHDDNLKEMPTREKCLPILTESFEQNFIDMVLNDQAFYYALLLRIERTPITIFANTSIYCTAIEMLASSYGRPIINGKKNDNRERLKSVFENNDVAISQKELNKMVDMRNKYQHGNLLRHVTLNDVDDDNEDCHNYLFLQCLLSMLIARIAGYDGIICRYDRIINRIGDLPDIDDVYIPLQRSKAEIHDEKA